MDLSARARLAADNACKAVGTSLGEGDKERVAEIVERAMKDAIEAASRESSSTVMACCSHDKDMAHKIAKEIEQAHQALIANLTALR